MEIPQPLCGVIPAMITPPAGQIGPARICRRARSDLRHPRAWTGLSGLSEDCEIPLGGG